MPYRGCNRLTFPTASKFSTFSLCNRFDYQRVKKFNTVTIHTSEDEFPDSVFLYGCIVVLLVPCLNWKPLDLRLYVFVGNSVLSELNFVWNKAQIAWNVLSIQTYIQFKRSVALLYHVFWWIFPHIWETMETRWNNVGSWESGLSSVEYDRSSTRAYPCWRNQRFFLLEARKLFAMWRAHTMFSVS